MRHLLKIKMHQFFKQQLSDFLLLNGKIVILFMSKQNNVFAVWLIFIAELVVKPTHQKLKFAIGKVS